MTEKEYKESVLQCSDNVFRFLYKNMKSVEEAEDVLQDSLLTLWNNHNSVEKEKAKSYLFTVAYRNMLNVLKYNKIRTGKEETNTEITTNDYDNKQLVSYALEQLPEKMRSCLLLKDWEGYKTSEISEMLNISEENVKIIIFRARRMLREILIKQ